jgi:hypothetical protein
MVGVGTLMTCGLVNRLQEALHRTLHHQGADEQNGENPSPSPWPECAQRWMHDRGI